MNRKILLWFDVEDYLTPESDDAFFELLKMLNESGVKSTIKFCTKKLSQLKERGRTDIIEKLANHEMGFHTTLHSVHPLPSEYLDGFGFKEGAAEFERRERPGFLELQDLSGTRITSYGQPGESWAPQVFPVLRKWGVPTYLDVHPIVGTDGQPFWFGGVLCFTKLNNLTHLVKDGSAGAMIRYFDSMDLDCTDTVFLSIYDHPTEFSSSIFWDEVNFLDGRNPYTCQPAPLRTSEERDALIDQYREFIEYTRAKDDIEYVTALESLRFEHQRQQGITKEQIGEYAASMRAEVKHAKIGDAYLSASELIDIMARYLSGRMLLPEMIYGPEAFEKSVVNGPIDAVELAETIFNGYDRVLGYKQLRSLYRVGDSFINPVDAFCMMAKAIAGGAQKVDYVRGRLAAADHVNEQYRFGGGWILFGKEFKGERIFEHTRLQTWTLKPAIF